MHSSFRFAYLYNHVDESQSKTKLLILNPRGNVQVGCVSEMVTDNISLRPRQAINNNTMRPPQVMDNNTLRPPQVMDNNTLRPPQVMDNITLRPYQDTDNNFL